MQWHPICIRNKPRGMAIDSMTAHHEDNFISIYSCDRLASSFLAVDLGEQCGLHDDEDYEDESGFNDRVGPLISRCRRCCFVLPERLVRFGHSGMVRFWSAALLSGH